MLVSEDIFTAMTLPPCPCGHPAVKRVNGVGVCSDCLAKPFHHIVAKRHKAKSKPLSDQNRMYEPTKLNTVNGSWGPLQVLETKLARL